MDEFQKQRAEFAMHAPEVPDWFICEPNEAAPAIPRADKELSRAAYAALNGERVMSEAHAAEIQAFCDKTLAANAELNQWNNRVNMRRLTAWRWAYADAMMTGYGK